MKSTPQTHFAKLVQEFFLDRLIRQRNSSPQTVAAYRDCFRLLFEFARNTGTSRRSVWSSPISMLLLYWRSWIISRKSGRIPFAAGTLD